MLTTQLYFLKVTRRLLKIWFMSWNSWKKMSGLKLNLEKTSNVWFGNKRNREIFFYHSLKQFKILGLWFTNDLTKMAELNITDKFDEPKRLFNIWAKRSITPLVEQQYWSHWHCPNLYTYGSCFQTHLTIPVSYTHLTLPTRRTV